MNEFRADAFGNLDELASELERWCAYAVTAMEVARQHRAQVNERVRRDRRVTSLDLDGLSADAARLDRLDPVLQGLVKEVTDARSALAAQQRSLAETVARSSEVEGEVRSARDRAKHLAQTLSRELVRAAEQERRALTARSHAVALVGRTKKHRLRSGSRRSALFALELSITEYERARSHRELTGRLSDSVDAVAFEQVASLADEHEAVLGAQARCPWTRHARRADEAPVGRPRRLPAQWQPTNRSFSSRPRCVAGGGHWLAEASGRELGAALEAQYEQAQRRATDLVQMLRGAVEGPACGHSDV
ncbi:MAG: hypothetical protein R2715_19945 [Ilumatobacteraceae bacterium]